MQVSPSEMSVLAPFIFSGDNLVDLVANADQPAKGWDLIAKQKHSLSFEAMRGALSASNYTSKRVRERSSLISAGSMQVCSFRC